MTASGSSEPPMICLVTDRRRLTAGAPGRRWRTCLVEQVRFAVQAGVDLVQVRERDLDANELAGLVSSLVTVTRGSRTRLVVNDRIDVALACGADGVHLRGDSIGVEDARSLAPEGFLIGRSVHSVTDAVRAAGADYLIAGSVFPSPSKARATAWLGAAGLRAIVRASRPPVLAIGGIDDTRFDEIAETGAAGIAAIGLFIRSGEVSGTESGGVCRSMPLEDLLGQARARFDSILLRP
jgi:thiamine-phosphate pyrophosphorylase